jgi:hypothetical protein
MQLPADLAHASQNDCAVVAHARGASLQGRRKNRCELGRLLPSNISRRNLVVVVTRRIRAINSWAPFNHVEVEFKNPPLAQYVFRHRHQSCLRAFAENRASCSEEQILDQLLRQRGTAACAAALQILLRRKLNGVPIEAVVLVEARVLRGDDRVLEIGRNLADRNEIVAFVIRRQVYQGLQAALDVHSGCRRIDPPRGHKGQSGKRPKQRHREDKPFNKGAEGALTTRRLWECGGRCSHTFRIIVWAGWLLRACSCVPQRRIVQRIVIAFSELV